MKLRDWANTRNGIFTLSIAVIVVYLLPLILLGEDAFIRIRENLTSGAIYPKLLIESGTVFASSDTIVPQLNMPRVVLGSEFSLLILLHNMFSSINAYIIGFTITRITAFCGMYLLLKRHFLPDDKDDRICILVSMCFTILPFLSYTGISIAGQPLALYSFLNFRNRKQSWKDWLILLGIPFYSSFVLSFLFFLAMVGVIWVYDLLRRRDLNPVFLLAIVFMTLVFVGVEYRLLLFQLNPFFVSHRSEFGRQYEFYLTPIETIKLIMKNIMVGQIHARSLQSLSIGISLVLALWLFIRHRTRTFSESRMILILIGTIVFIAALKGVLHSEAFLGLFSDISLIKTFNFSRFYWLQPLLWHIVFALSLVSIKGLLKNRGKHIAYGLIIVQVLFCFFMSDFYKEKKRSSTTFKEFFAEEQFREIRNYIAEPLESYRVISIGMYPATPLFNGFYTADFYLSNYPLEYKHRFRKVIEKELDKVPRARLNYDEWGNTVYAFSSEVKRWGMKTPIRNLEFNIEAMKELNIKYVLSRFPIENQFTFMKSFYHPESARIVYLYRVFP